VDSWRESLRAALGSGRLNFPRGESLRAALSPDRVAFVRMQPGWPGRLAEPVATRAVPGAAPDSGEPPWAAALAALGEGLSGIGPRGAKVTVVLSNHFVRYQLVPWNDALADAAEEIAHARHCFSRVYGDVAEAWDIRLSADPGGAQLACAVDRELLASLEQVVAASGRRLHSVQPYLMAAFNPMRRELAGPLVWLVLAEHERLCLAALRNGRWHTVVNLQTDDGWDRGLPELLSRQRLLAGLDEGADEVWLVAPDERAAIVLQRAGEKVRPLRGTPLPTLSRAEAACVRMALGR
jgi:hypothetical protein